VGLFDIPDPVSIFESAKTSGLEREAMNALMSASYSATITAMWRSGSAKWADFTGEGQALKDAATAMYLTLSQQLKPGFLTLTVPQDLLDANNLARFETELKVKT
jgi:hypothetical protein